MAFLKAVCKRDLSTSEEITYPDGRGSSHNEREILNMAWCLPLRLACGLMPEAFG